MGQLRRMDWQIVDQQQKRPGERVFTPNRLDEYVGVCVCNNGVVMEISAVTRQMRPIGCAG